MRAKRAIVLAVTCGLAGCAYKPGSFATMTGAFPGTPLTVGCIDLAVESQMDAEARGPVAGISFANRCDGAVTLDLRAITAAAHTKDGRTVPLVLYNPLGEIHPAALEARIWGREVLEWDRLDADAGAEADVLTSLCLDLTRVDADAPSPGRPVTVCVAL